MSIEKSELRAAAIHDFGIHLDDGLEKMVLQKNQAMGAAIAHDRAVQDITVLKFKVQEDVDSKEMDMETAKIVLRWLDRSANVCANLSKQAQNMVLKAEGMEMGMKMAVEMASKAVNMEKMKAVPSPKATEDGGRRKTIKQRRLAEKPVRKKAVKKKA